MLKNWCLSSVVPEKTPESPLDSKIKPVNIKGEINSEYSLDGLMLKMKLQYLGHLMWTDDSLEKSLMLGKIEGRRRRGRQRMRWLDSIISAMNMNLGKLGYGEGQGDLQCCSPWGRKELDITGRLNNNKQRKQTFYKMKKYFIIKFVDGSLQYPCNWSRADVLGTGTEK